MVRQKIAQVIADICCAGGAVRPSEAAKLAGVSRTMIYRLMGNKRLTVIDVGGRSYIGLLSLMCYRREKRYPRCA